MIFNLSDFNSHWQTKKLEQLGTFKRGKSKHRPRNDEKLFENGSYPLIQTGEVKESSLFIDKHTQTYNEFGLKQSKLWDKNTLCITIAANIAETAILKYPMCFPDSIVGFNAYENESSELFMHYVFTYIKKSIQNSASGSIQDNINIDYLTKLKFKIPQKKYQDKIVDILFSLDSKIELNNKINKELESMAKTLYDYWFVQFDFPNENGQPYKSSGGKMVYNEELKREIPQGWEVKKLNEFYNFLEGPGITKDKYSDNGHKFINIKCIIDEDLNVSDASMIENSYIAGYKHFLLEENDIVLSTSGTLGRTAIVRKAHLPLLLNTSVIRFRAKEKNIFEYMYLYLKSEYFLNNLNKMATGSIQKNFGPTHLEQIKDVFPDDNTLKRFHNKLQAIIRQLIVNKEQNQELAKLRDWLLPMLMNGQVRVEANQDDERL